MDQYDIRETKFFALEKNKVLQILQSSFEGLEDKEVKRRQKTFGKNEIIGKRRLGRVRIFVRQFQNPIIYILLAAGIITLILQDYTDSLFIFFAALINAVLGFYQENKAEAALEKLRHYIDDQVLVARDGVEKEISTKELVPGDIIRLQTGSKVPADARVLSLNDLRVDEAVLTGESLAQKKSDLRDKGDTQLTDRLSMLFAGTVITQGYARAVVTATGNETEIGRIASLVAKQEYEKTPMQKSLQKFLIKASSGIIAFSVLIFFLARFSGAEFLDAFLISVAVLVASVPEGLPIVMTIILATGVQRLAAKNGVVRKLSAAETLGSTTVILTDKTGTLTEAKMELDQLNVFEKQRKGETKLEELLLYLSLFNVDAVVENPKDDASAWKISGKSLEKSLVKEAAVKHSVFLPDLQGTKEEINSLPFNSKNKFSATYYKTTCPTVTEHFKKEKVCLVTLLGAPEILLERSVHGEEKKEEILSQVEKLAFAGGRVIALAYKELKDKPGKQVIDNEMMSDLHILGLLSFKDPIKPGVKDALKEVTAAGIKTVLVTGDHGGTAISVAGELGMVIEASAILTGRELDTMSDEKLKERAKNLKIVSRVSPEGKMRLAKAFQENGEIVAMNGDGVNDAPAIKQADIGIAMGSGTDVAKQAADLVLLDDNFETIVEAIKEGHRIVQNMRKGLVYLSSTILDEIFIIAAAILVGVPVPFTALQILWTNFFASLPGLSLAFEDKIDSIEAHPTKIRKGIFTNRMKFLLLVNGTISSILIIILYFLLLYFGVESTLAKTITFAAFSSYSLLLILGLRSLRRSIFTYNPFSNQALNVSLLLGFALVAVSIYVPFFQGLFGTIALSFNWVMLILVFGILNILLIEGGKALFRK